MYLDAAYIVKLYVAEPESAKLAEVVRRARSIRSSMLSIAEVHCAFHRLVREKQMTPQTRSVLATRFEDDIEAGHWRLAPVSEKLLKRTASLHSGKSTILLRAGDAIHLLTAQELGEREIWTGDRHMLAAAPFFSLIGRSV